MENTFFYNIFLSGLSLGLSSCFSSCGFMLPYIFATKKNPLEGFHSVIFLFLGRMFYFMFVGSLSGLDGRFILSIIYESRIMDYVGIFLGVIIIFIGFLIITSGIKKYKFLDYIYRWDYFFMFLLGIIIGALPDISSKMFLSDLIFNTNNYFFGFISGFLFGISSFISPLILLALLFGYVAQKIIKYFPNLYPKIQKICGALMVFLGLEKIVTAWIAMNV